MSGDVSALGSRRGRGHLTSDNFHLSRAISSERPDPQSRFRSQPHKALRTPINKFRIASSRHRPPDWAGTVQLLVVRPWILGDRLYKLLGVRGQLCRCSSVWWYVLALRG